MFSLLQNSFAAKIVAGLIAISAIGFGLWFWSGKDAAGLTHRFVVGQRLVYQVEYLTASTSNFMGLGDDEKPADGKQQAATNIAHTNVEGEMVATVLETSRDGALVALQLRNATIQIVTNGDLAVDQGDIVKSDLRQPIFAEIDAQGRVVKVRFAADAQPLSQSFARSLTAATQVVLPSDAGAKTWDTCEDDPNGKYVATYTLASPADGETIKIEKRRTSYVPKPRKQRMHSFESETQIKPAGKVAIEFDALDGIVKSAVGEEQTTVIVEGRVVARSEATLRLTLQGREMANKAELASLRAKRSGLGEAQALSAVGDTSKRDLAIQKTQLGDATLDSLLTELAKRQAGIEMPSDDTQLYLKLKALIHLQPDVCVQLAKELSVVSTDGPAMGLLSGALSSVGHPQAQTALQIAILARPNDWSALMVLVPALGMVENPTPDSEQLLRDLARDAKDEHIRSTAQLSLGIMARSLADAAPARHRRILDETIKALDEAASVEARRQNLLVLGNIGAEETLAIVKRYVSHEASQVRAAAVAALRWLEDASIDGLLVNALTTDRDEPVRLEAAQALTLRPMTAALLAVHRAALAKDSSATVRLALLRNVAQAHRGFSDARGILADVARTDGATEVREEGDRLLAEIGR
ncbi:MAG: HEAT repeat domain-containing protein [Planctomycetes bacterium]|nr:HEAT repeat domain-containing protein [Planctomycetota bacterium]